MEGMREPFSGAIGGLAGNRHVINRSIRKTVPRTEEYLVTGKCEVPRHVRLNTEISLDRTKIHGLSKGQANLSVDGGAVERICDRHAVDGRSKASGSHRQRGDHESKTQYDRE